MLETKIIVYSKFASICSNFIISLLSLFPGFLYFRFSSQTLTAQEFNHRDYGLPLRFFDEGENILSLHTILQDMDQLISKQSFLIATTNCMIKQSQKM